VYARGNDRRRIYLNDRDRRAYLSMLGATVARTGWSCLAYCLMRNHVHLLLETPQPNLAYGMQRLHGDYARRFNARYDRTGHLFEGRYGSVRVETDVQLWMVARYIALNPVDAKVCDRPEEYDWSSHRAVVRGDGPRFLDTGRLLSYFEALGPLPHERYQAFVDGRALSKGV
jgi:REP element-mobilizing transposase RayT